MTPSRDIARLVEIMAALRDPVTGCPWDIKQSFASIAPYTVEEAYEVADAIERGDLDDLQDELGDLLLQVVFHARMAEEQGRFDFGGVVQAITEKLIRRHPHVFGEGRAGDEEAVRVTWEAVKAQERAARGRQKPVPQGVLAGVPAALPGLTRAVKLQDKAGRVGFDWADPRLVMDKIEEELAEVGATIEAGSEDQRIDEIGDLLFAVANLARHLKVDPEAALRRANAKFERRFGFIERALAAEGRAPAESSLEEMDSLWDAAKRAEREPDA